MKIFSFILLLIPMVTVWGYPMAPDVSHAATPEFRTVHQTPVLTNPSATTRFLAERKDQSAAEQVMEVAEAGGPFYNAGESMSGNMVSRLNRLSINQRSNALRSLGMNQRNAHAAAQNIGKNIKKFGERLDFLDKAGTAAEVAGAAAGGDAVGAGQAVVNSTLSGLAAAGGGATGAAAGAWLGVKAGAAVGAVGGPLGAAIGGAVGAVGGAVAASYAYDWYGKPTIDSASDKVAAELIALEENAEKERRRIRADFHTVYPQGAIFSPENPMPSPEALHRMAQAIRDPINRERQIARDREKDRLLGVDDCPNDPNKTRPGLCGCGVPDTDSDGDLVPDCMDQCPNNPRRYEPGPFGCNDQVMVPQVTGKKVDLAVGEISERQLTPAVAGGDPAPEKAREFTVQSQSPAGGAAADIGSPVQIRIFSAFKPVIPNVIGLSAEEARALISSVGLTPAITKGDVAPRAELNGKVQAQSPGAGQGADGQTTVTVSVYADFKSAQTAADNCPELESAFLGALSAENYVQGKEILARSQHCGFYAQGVGQVKKMECLSNGIAFLDAIKSGNTNGARGILAANKDCDFYSRYGQQLECTENLNQMSAAVQANDINLYRAILSRSQNCGFHDSLAASLRDAERQAMAQNQRNQQLAAALGQALGGLLQGMAAGGTGGGGRSMPSGGGGGSTTSPPGPPVIKHGTCNDVRKAGANQPERHVIDLGIGGNSFIFEFETYTEEDMIIVSQRGNTLFSSGCVGTKGRRSVRITKGLGSEVIVDVRPNCAGGTNTQWEFIVHCPK